MDFVNLTEEEFNTFALLHPCSNFHQTTQWGKLKEKNGWISHLIGIKENDTILAATLLLEKKIGKYFSLFYAPRGYLIDFHNENLLTFFTENIKKYTKKRHGIFVKIDPYIIHKERDLNGNVVEGGIDNEDVVLLLKKLGYKHTGFNLGQENMQPRWAFAIDLKGKKEEDILKNMEAKTRQLIHKNERNEIIVREIGEEELETFKEIMNHTSKRRNFIDRPFSYYKNMLEVLKEHAKIYIAEINIGNLIEKTKAEIAENEKIIEQKKKDIEQNPKISIDKAKKKIQELEEVNNRLEKKVNHYEELKNEDGEVLTLGGIIYMIYNKEILSLFGGSYDKYMEFYSFYSIHWKMIQYAIQNGYTKYNFYGISGNFQDKDDELYGIYDFKRGFGGHVEEYIGEFNFILNPVLYFFYQHAFQFYKKHKR